MSNKKLAIFYFILSILFLAGFFGFKKLCLAEPIQITINEIMPAPKTGEKEFVEFYNAGEEKINLENWRLKDANLEKTSTPEKDRSCVLPAMEIAPKDYAIFYLNKCAGKDYAISLNNTDGDELNLYNPTDISPIFFVSYMEDAKSNYSYSFDGTEWRWSKYPTPGKENIFKKDYPDGIYLNEILPDPKEDEKKEEFIELYNSSDKDIDLEDWIIKDATKTGYYVFSSGAKIKSEQYLAVYRKEFDFALNNSGSETVFLLDPNDDTISSVSYSDSKENISYNFDGENWRWSKFLTPGAKNQFNNLPQSSEKKDKNIYVGMYADFESKAKDKDRDKLKFTWDFGDGHKSYKQKTRHKYEKIGKYKVTLKIFDGSEDKIETFNIEVKKYPERKMRIVGIVPNPEGKDSDNEYILVKNKSKKTVNLKDWSVATGSKKLYNHPITKDLVADPGDTIKISKKYSKFSLNNKKAKLELRYPNGKVADKAKYDLKDKSAADNAIYEKTDAGWQWNIPQDISEDEQNTESAPAIQEDTEIRPEDLGKQTLGENKMKNKIVLANYATNLSLPENLEIQPRVLGASTVRDDSDYFSFGRPYAPEPHWAVKFARFLGNELNQLLNNLINYF